MNADHQSIPSGRTILSEQWLGLLDLLKVGAFIIDLEHRITGCNPCAQALFGMERGEMVGRDCRKVFRGAPCTTCCPHSEEITEPQALEVELLDADENVHLVTRLSAPIYGDDGRLTGHLILIQDRPSLGDLLKRVRYGEKSLKIILDHLELALFTVNRGGHITFFNDAAETMTGYHREEVLGKSASMILGPEGNGAWCELKTSLSEGHAGSSGPAKILAAEGDIVEIKADFMPLTNDREQFVGALVTLHDLTLARQLDEVITEHVSFHNMIGRDPSMQKIFEMVEQVAPSDATVLIEGATGTGKDHLARAIHAASHRSDQPMVKVNCAALPNDLLESEMFGYAAGAFTGAVRDKPGRIQEADGGTILLDEIGDLPLPVQGKLLRVLEDREFYPLGERHTVKVDVRIIAATNRDLQGLLTEGLFREDLFYRLNVCRIELPTLKDRRADLPLLIRHILRRLSAARQGRPSEISADAMEVLLRYHYPGNVRELENILEYALLTCRGKTIRPEHIQSYVHSRAGWIDPCLPPRTTTAARDRDIRERRGVLEALERHQWRRKKTAQALGIDRTTLWRKMKKYGLS
ncbi:MAG: sigma 54-interacting transcriptional regulator [Desulfobacteraceae bacterium]|jgi:PAS domain S-box-containing protein